MSLPLYMKDYFGYPSGLLIGTLLGFAFGFVLERSGFGRSTILAAQFYFKDTRVLKVMFSSIVTALLGMTILSGLGVLDMDSLRVPPTFLWPQLVGGLLLGAGFIISGYCPGTGVVAMASGKLDGAAAIFGVVAGSVLFGFLFPLYPDFYTSGSMGVVRFPELIGLPQAILALGVALMAMGAFVGAEKMEKITAKKENAPVPPGAPSTRRRVFALFAAASLAGLVTILLPAPEKGGAEPLCGKITPLELARIGVEDPTSVYLVDLRYPAAEPEQRIPGSYALAEEDREAAFLATLPPTRKLVLYGEGAIEKPPAAAADYGGEVLLLEGGYRAFADEILTAPVMGGSPDTAEIADHRLRSALYAHYTGSEAEAAPRLPPKRVTRPSQKKSDGC